MIYIAYPGYGINRARPYFAQTVQKTCGYISSDAEARRDVLFEHVDEVS
jgi:hypothetical protein